MINITNDNISDIVVGNIPIEKAYLGNQLIWEKSSPVLPYDAQVEWLGFTASQYVLSGVSATLNFSAEINFSPSSNNLVVFGSRSSATSRNFSVMSGIDVIYADFGNYNSTRCTLDTTISDGHWYKVTMSKSKRRIEDLDTGVYSEQTAAYSSSFTTPQQLRIGGKGSNFPNSYAGFSGKFGKISIWNGDTLVRDFIPVRVGTTGYLWDNVTMELFGNNGSGSFTLWPDVT